MTTINKEVTFTRIKNDTNGNPRYVCHYLVFNTDYVSACKLANTIGGRKFHNKQYGGGIVFSSYNINELCKHIERVAVINITSITID